MSLWEYLEFDKAVGVGIEMTKADDTILLVSADHSHVFTLGGYGKRGTDIFGLGEKEATYISWETLNGTDEENIHLIGYANGPGYKVQLQTNETTKEQRCGRQRPSETEEERADPTNNPNTLWPTSHPIKSETHGADDVALLGNTLQLNQI